MRQILFLFVIVIIIIIVPTKSNAQIQINEILASNTSINIDPLSKDFDDWLELYNNTDQEISIGDWYLSDDRSVPAKWKIPFFFSIKPKEYKLFWLDNLNTSNHTNFKLDADGESIYLFNKDTVLIDSIVFPKQITDISYGRITGSINEFVYFDVPTPSEENPSYGIATVDFAERPIFSMNAGIYEDPITLEISATPASSEIYYTLDGSSPTTKSNKYLQPIEISDHTVIRARVYAKNKLPGEIMTQTYIIGETFSLPVVSLAMNPEFLWDDDAGIYVNGLKFKEDVWESANYFQPWERPANVEFFDLVYQQSFNISAGVRIHGRSTRRNAQKTLAVLAKKKFGTQIIPAKLFGEQSSDTIKSFLLRNGGNDWGMTMVQDGLVHSLVMDKVDIDAQMYRPAVVFLNGEYWGIHNLREKINEHYIKNRYHISTENLDIIEADVLEGELKASFGNMNEYNKMIEFIENNSLSIEENYDTIKEWIDINELINYLVTEVYIRNKDWPGSNMKFWKSDEGSVKWRWLLYDTELSFQEKNKSASFNILEHMLSDDPEYKTPLWSNYLIRKLFKNDQFRDEFIQRLAVYLHTVFDADHIFYVLDSLKKNIEPEMERHMEKWGGIRQKAVPYLLTANSYEEWEANFEFVKRFVENRPADIRRKMIQYFNLSDTVNLKLRINDPDAGQISLMGLTLDEGNFDGYVFANVPVRIEAIPSKGYEFVKWKGGGDMKECWISLKYDKKLTAVFRKIE